VKFDPKLPDDTVNVSPAHPLREVATLVGGIAAIGAVLFFGIAVVIEWLVPRIPPAFEARLFSQLGFGDSVGRGSGPNEDGRQAAVSELLERLAAHWRENPYTLRVVIFEEQAPNAVAFPGGLVVATTGLLDGVASENEIAFVLAHEIGHFRNRDHLRGIGRGVVFGLAMNGLGIGGSFAAAQIASAVGSLAATGFSREQERDADRFALGLVHAEYGHVAGASDFFVRLADSDGSADSGIAHYLSTHPQSDDRVEAMAALATVRGWARDGTLARFAGSSEDDAAREP
jgi:Zn-dependent protease with chaperone function